MSASTSHQNPIPPTHEDFHWIFGSGQHARFVDFIELTRDVTAGVSTFLQIIYASELAREINQEGDPEQQAAPATGKTDTTNLFRLSLAVTTLLRDAAQQRIDRLNEFLK